MNCLRYLVAISALTTCLTLAPSAHADMVIDNYNQNYVNPNGSTVIDADILGGVRTVRRDGQASVSLNGSSESLTAYGNSFSGPATEMGVGDNWGRNLNLNLTAYSGVQVDFAAVNQTINLTVGLSKATGNYTAKGWFSSFVVKQGDTSIFLPFSSFSRIAGTDYNLDLTDIDGVGALFKKTNAYTDVPNVPVYSVDNIKFVGVIPSVPEPETYAMLLAGLGLMGAIARRRKNKQVWASRQ